MRKYAKWMLIGAAIVLAVVISIIFFGNISAEDIISHSPSSIVLTILVFVALYAIKSVVMFIPLPVLFISAGVLFPKGWAIVISYFCLTMELTIDWWIGKKMGRTKVVDLVRSKPKMASLVELYKERTVFTCFLSRLIPIQSEPFSVFFGAAQMPYPTYLGISLLGLSAKMIPFILAGSAISDPLSKEFLLPLAVCVAISITVLIIVNKIGKRRKRIATAPTDTAPDAATSSAVLPLSAASAADISDAAAPETAPTANSNGTTAPPGNNNETTG